MRAGPVVLLSVVAHAPFVALVAMWATPTRRPRVVVPAPLQVVPSAAARAAASEPIEVAFLVEEPPREPPKALPDARRATAAAAATVPASATASVPATASAPATGTAAVSATATAPVPETGRGTGTSPGLLHMRGPDLGLDPGTAERIAAHGGTAPREELHRSGKLESEPGGRAAIYDRVTTVTVDRDGTAHFADKKDIDLHFKLPIPKVWEVEEMRKDIGHVLTEWYKDPYAATRYGPTSQLPRHLLASEGACNSWGDLMCDDPLAPQIEARVRERTKSLGGKGLFGTILGGAADITGYLHRKYVGDPYASRKRKLLDDTRDERVAMGVAFRAEQAARSAEIMRGNLERLWQRESRAIARRAALFELWDECGEDEPGQRARAMVIGWIRSHLPAGSADAYSADELAALQARRTSAAPFAPYAE